MTELKYFDVLEKVSTELCMEEKVLKTKIGYVANTWHAFSCMHVLLGTAPVKWLSQIMSTHVPKVLQFTLSQTKFLD